MRYGVWLLMFAEGTDANRQSMKCHQLPVCMGNTAQLGGASGDVFPPSANREMGAGTNETGRSPLLFFCCTDVDEGTDFVLS